MLTNEKYCGNVLVVKTYTTPFPELKRTTNKSEKKQYLAVGAHPASFQKSSSTLSRKNASEDPIKS